MDAADDQPATAVATPDSLAEVEWRSFDFLDLGCSKGGSLRHCQRRFGAERGLGVDVDADKVRVAREAGYDAVAADATQLGLAGRVRFVSMMDFLEHLPGLDIVEAVLASAAEAATDFLFIQHPSFESEEWLVTQGLRQYWHHWSGHTAHIHIDDFCGMFERLGLRQYMIRYAGPVYDSTHPSIVPAAAPRNQHAYDPSIHPPKPSVGFPRPLWRAQYIFVGLRDLGADEWASVTRSV